MARGARRRQLGRGSGVPASRDAPGSGAPSADVVEAALRRFDRRVDTALERSPPSKDWVRNALRRQGAPRCPVRLRRLSYEIILRHGDLLAGLFARYPDDAVFAESTDFFIGYQAPGDAGRMTPARTTQPGTWTDEWGTRWEHAAGGVAASPIGHPLGDWSLLDEYLAHRLPDPSAPGRMDGALPALNAHGPTRYFAGVAYMALFERFHCLRGMENALLDLYLYPRETARLLDALVDFDQEIIRSWGRLEHVDAVYMTDDWGTQSALMISPEMWRRFFGARYRRLCEEAHRGGLHVIFHSCGQVTEIIGDLIDAGVDVIDPLQPEAVDLQRVAREYGGKVAFSGGLGDQRLAFVAPRQVRDDVRRAIDTLGARFGNAYLLSPSNTLMPEVPPGNLQALFEACHDQ